MYTFVKWAVIYWTGLFPFRWSHIFTSPSWAVAKVFGDRAFQRTWDDAAKKQIMHYLFTIKKLLSIEIWYMFILPTADRDRHGFLWSLISQICMNVSILQEAIMSGSLGCQFRSLITRVCAFRLCVVCNSCPPAVVKLNISTRELLWNRKMSIYNKNTNFQY